MKKTKQLNKVAMLVLAAVAAGFVTGCIRRNPNSPLHAWMRHRAQVVHAAGNPAEYTLTLVERVTSGPASSVPVGRDHAVSSRTIYATRQDGPRVRIFIAYVLPGSAQKPLEQRWIYDFAEKKQIWFVKEAAVKSTTSLSDQAIAQMLANSSPGSDCAARIQATVVGEDMIQGWRALILRDPSGDSRWVIPQFGCNLVRRTSPDWAVPRAAAGDHRSPKRDSPGCALVG